jgi:hypothetical protein
MIMRSLCEDAMPSTTYNIAYLCAVFHKPIFSSRSFGKKKKNHDLYLCQIMRETLNGFVEIRVGRWLILKEIFCFPSVRRQIQIKYLYNGTFRNNIICKISFCVEY